jgi:hypothetical protein
VNTHRLLSAFAAGLLGAAGAVATPAAVALTAHVLDRGGGRAVSADLLYAVDATLGGVHGLAAPEPGGEGAVVRAGYLGQLFEVEGVEFVGGSPGIAEESFFDLAAAATLHDGTFILADGPATQPPLGFFTWSAAASGTISSLVITPAGRLLAGAVYADTPVIVTVTQGLWQAQVQLEVRDVLGDNWGGYAGDGLRDRWQVQNFGEDNPAAGPLAAPFGDGVVNLLKHAWNVPADDRLNAPTGEVVGGYLRLVYRRLKAHVQPRPTYRVEVSSDLITWRTNGDPGGPYTEEVAVVSLDEVTERVVVRDLIGTAAPPRRFIRLRVDHP